MVNIKVITTQRYIFEQKLQLISLLVYTMDKTFNLMWRKNKMKKLLALLTVALVGCGGGGSNHNAQPESIKRNNNTSSTAQPSTPNLPSNQKLVRIPFDLSYTDEVKSVTLDGSTISSFSVDTLKNQPSNQIIKKPVTVEVMQDNGKTHSIDGHLSIYKQNYSALIDLDLFYSSEHINDSSYSDFTFDATPVPTVDNLIANKVIANYAGVAYHNYQGGSEDGKLEYTIDFGQRQGWGKITGISGAAGDITLHQASIKPISTPMGRVYGIEAGDVSIKGKKNYEYQLGIAGPNAEEVVGLIEAKGYIDSSDLLDRSGDIGFIGKRQ